MARQERGQTISWLLLTTTAIGFLAAISFSPISIALAQSFDQEKCTADAKETFQDVEREYAAESRLADIQTASSTYSSHYNTKIHRCFLSISRAVSLTKETSDASYLLDTNQRLYASYFATGGETPNCTLMPTVRKTTNCKTREEFDAFVTKYMEE